MAEFLTTSGISYQIENIIVSSKKTLFLISPYLQISKNFYERLCDADKKGVITTIIYGKNKLSEADQNKLNSLSCLQLYFFNNLHAKCYANEEKMVITSMNMYEFSEKNNREMGILIERRSDYKAYQKAFEEIDSIINSAIKERSAKIKESNSAAVSTRNQEAKEMPKKPTGFCIRCKTDIRLNPNYPLCPSCFDVWRQWGNTAWIENYCHICGNKADTTIEKALCYSCKKEYRKLVM